MKPVRALTFGGLLAALHIIATILLHFAWIPGIELIILFIVPFFSAMYSYKCKFRETIIFALATLIVCTIIDPTAGLLYILPTLAVGVVYGELVKHKANGTTIVYTLTILEFALFFLSAVILKWFTSVDIILSLKTIFHLAKTKNDFLSLGLLLGYSFMQAFLLHFILRAQLKRMGITVTKTTNPPFWVLILSIASLIACFMPWKQDIYIIFTTTAAIVFSLPIALYGYQITSKPWIILAVQAVVFLGGTLPLLKVYTSYQAVLPYIILFAPPVLYALYELIMHTYVQQPAKVTNAKSTKKDKK